MQRIVGPLLLVFAVSAPGFAEDTGRSTTLAQRFGDLRRAYALSKSKASDEAPAELAQVSADAEIATTGEETGLPRVDHRSLVPKPWLTGGRGNESRSSRYGSAKQGSAGARLMRDVRRGRSITSDADIAAGLGRPSSARAGSALSKSSAKPDATQNTSQPTEPKSSRATAALARSIANDVAASMAGDRYNDSGAVSKADQETQKPTEEPAPKVAAKPKPAPKPVKAKPVAKASPVKKVPRIASAKRTTDRLPLTIGPKAPVGSTSTQRTVSVTANESRVRPVASKPSSRAMENDLLVSQKMPVILSRVSGPRTIVVGREATYRVTIENRGDAAASRLVAKVTAPEWAEVVGSTPSGGSVETPSSYDRSGEQVCQWRMDRLSQGEKATLDLRMIARAGRPIELGVSWVHAPVDSMTVVEVQEPKLAMHLSGPDEVLFGKSQLFRLTVSNPGTGVAESVRLRLTPPGESHKSIEHSLDSIPAGESRSVEIELTAREAGSLVVEANVSAEGGLNADATKEIFCRKPELAVDWRGPDHRYAGAPASYFFRVRNPGTAVAQRVELEVQLPAGFEVTPSPETPDAVGGRLTYRVGALRPGDDRYFELRGVMRTAGANQLVLRAAGSDDTRSEVVTATTEVVALADLKLDIQDPRGPIATGEEIPYKIRVTNRGTTEARDVQVVGLFSEGIEPGRAEGNASRIDINDGRVEFGTIDVIAAGASREFTIYARAHTEGNHLFRTEVTCRDLEIQLAAEETTRFFEDEPIDIADSDSGYRYQR